MQLLKLFDKNDLVHCRHCFILQLKETQEYVAHLQPSLDSIKLQVEETNKIGDEEKRVMEEQRKAEEEMRKKQFVEQQKEKEKKKSPPPPNIPTDSKTCMSLQYICCKSSVYSLYSINCC